MRMRMRRKRGDEGFQGASRIMNDDGVWKHLDPVGRESESARAIAPPAFATRVMAHVRAEAAANSGWLASPASLRWAPAWAKVAAVLAVVCGLALGAGVAGWASSAPPATAGVDVAADFGQGFGDGYWQALETEDSGEWDSSLDESEERR